MMFVFESFLFFCFEGFIIGSYVMIVIGCAISLSAATPLFEYMSITGERDTCYAVAL